MQDCVSVVITTHKRPDRLKKALETVVNQTYKNLDIIVVDGSNLKENEDVVNMFNDDRIRYITVESTAIDLPNYTGMQHSRNIGCKVAKGKYIAMLDDDDIWDSKKIEKQLMPFKYKKNVALVVCYNKVIKGNKMFIDEPVSCPHFEYLLQSFSFSSTSTYMFDRDKLEEIGFWNEELRGIHEYDLALKLAKKGYSIFTVPEVLATKNNIAYLERNNYWIKIAEVMDFWKYYGKYFLHHIHIKGFIFNSIKTIGLLSMYLSGYVLKERIWVVLYPFKRLFSSQITPD